ncbi:uncharacterized protein EDB91DRAFT_1295911, partial [Suillus paluster]|uniref:uncharacterized protein n=1 Tax=Suillus paluster TaxID=48578 RepID=UPI001B874D88
KRRPSGSTLARKFHSSNSRIGLLCICHSPFINPTTARTCLHTFCHEYIIVALQYSSQCPVERSSLSLYDLSPVNPIVKHLVDELIVGCPNRASGCTQTFQRQLLSDHIKDACQCVPIPCSEEQCRRVILRKDVGGEHKDACTYRSTQCDVCGATIKNSNLIPLHNLEYPSKFAACEFCCEEFPRPQLREHDAVCHYYEIPCTHANDGCSWYGPRHIFWDYHSLSYRAIKD